MKRLLILLLAFISLNYNGLAQGVIKGRVIDQNQNPIQNASVQLLGTTYFAITDENGQFKIDNVKPGSYQIFVYAEGFNPTVQQIQLSVDKELDLGDIVLQAVAFDEDQAMIEVSQDEIAQEEAGEENISGLLHGSRDVFLSTAAFNLGMLRFKIRGYDYRYTEVSINGIPMENLDNGRVYWSLWGGLNDVTRFRTSYLGLDRNDLTFGNIGGSTNIDMYPSKIRKGLNVTYSVTNRSYRFRTMFTYATGLMDNDLAITISGSRRWANEGYIPGTFYDAWAYYIGVEKRIKNHSFVLNFFGAPIKRGKAGPTVQEAFDLTNNHYYNPYWGYQNDKKRNSRIANQHIPTLILTDVWKLDQNTKITTSIAIKYGRNGSTALNWYNAPDPRPDYYRYLPSYITNPEAAQIVAENFADPRYSQINWARLYDANRASYDIIYDANGIEGNVVEGLRAQYILEERRYDQRFFAISSVMNKIVNENLKVDAGFLARYSVTKNFKTLVDLLGADFWVDVDKYAERDFADPDSAQNDLRIPNHIIYEGDVFGYKYDAVVVNSRLWGQALYSLPKVDIYGAAYLSYTNFWRVGYMQNGRFPNNSLGKSLPNEFMDFGIKSGITYKITGRHYVVVHSAFMTLAPTFMNAFISPRTRDFVVDDLKSEKIFSIDAGYYLRAPKIKASVNVFYTKFMDRTSIKSFYHDGYRAFVNYVLTNIDAIHQGIELGLEANITSSITATAAGSVGYYRYSSRPYVTITVDNSAELLAKDKVVYLKGYLIPATPQTAGSIGLRYYSRHYWFAGFNVNYVDDNYVDINPERRTPEAVEYVIPGSEQWNAILAQEKLPGGFTLDAYFSKSFKIRDYFLYLNISVNNILNNQNIKTLGFEQLRFDMETKDPNKFPPKYFYYYGRQYFINLRFRF